jgi:uncharacterized protein YabE (DUF348 family)
MPVRGLDVPLPGPVPGKSKVWSAVLGFLKARVGNPQVRAAWGRLAQFGRRLPGGRTARIAASVVVLVAVVGGVVLSTGHDKLVRLSVDGQVRQVQVDAATVAGLLTAEQIRIGEHDIVAPAPATALADGDQVVVRFARRLEVTVDGRPQIYWTTELTVDRALAALGIHADGAMLSASRSEPIGRAGLALVVSTPKTVTLAADGRSVNLTTTAPTVGDLLAEQHVTVGPADKLSVVPATPVTNGLVVAVTRITQRSLTAVEKVPFGTTKKNTATLTVGQKKVLKAGTVGSRRATYTVMLVNGKEVGRTLVSATVLKAPVNQVVQVGTKPAPSTGGNVGGSVDSLNWPALAKCESGGNPKAVNPAGYYGLYQFSLSTWHSMGGTGNPIDATPAEQLYRAKLLYKKAGAGQWGCGQKLFT